MEEKRGQMMTSAKKYDDLLSSISDLFEDFFLEGVVA